MLLNIAGCLSHVHISEGQKALLLHMSETAFPLSLSVIPSGISSALWRQAEHATILPPTMELFAPV